MESPWLHRYAVLLAVCALLLVIQGAYVANSDPRLSGDPNAAQGQAQPQPQGHAPLGVAVGLLTIGLVVWLSIADKRTWLKKLGWVMLATAIVDGLLGGFTAGSDIPAVGIAHACLAQLFFAGTVAAALFTSASWLRGPVLLPDYGWPSLRSLAVTAPVFVLVQVILGASFRHKAMGVMPHIVGAMVVALVVLILGAFVLQQCPMHRSLCPAAKILMSITFVQVLLGIGTFIAGMQAAENSLAFQIPALIHVATGASTLAGSIVLGILIRRNVRPKGELAVSA